jgi:NAD(P)H-dependent flavin oxidoreductase YrpB (nitropropane dioxygenase family)
MVSLRGKSLKIGDLTARLPIIQGGMGVGVSLSGLASAVANEGGIGVISAAGIGMSEPNFSTNYLDANISALKKEIRKQLKDMTISESELYLWSFRADSEQGKKFRDWLTTIVLPNLREHGIYVNGMENMTPEEVKRVTDERIESYILRKHGINIRKSLTDTIKKYINPSPSECDRYYGGFTNIVYKVLFGLECKPYKALIGAKEKDNLRDYLKDNHMDKEINYITKAEDFMSNLIMSGVKDEKMLKSFLTNWYSNVAE